MSWFNSLFHNLNLSKKSQLGLIFRTGGSIMLHVLNLLFFITTNISVVERLGLVDIVNTVVFTNCWNDFSLLLLSHLCLVFGCLPLAIFPCFSITSFGASVMPPYLTLIMFWLMSYLKRHIISNLWFESSLVKYDLLLIL